MIIEEEMTQGISAFGLLFGVLGVLSKSKYFSWAGLALNTYSILNQRAGTGDARSGISILSFSVLQIVLLYTQLFTAPANGSIFDFGG
jgi:hypothetical protein